MISANTNILHVCHVCWISLPGQKRPCDLRTPSPGTVWLTALVAVPRTKYRACRLFAPWGCKYVTMLTLGPKVSRYDLLWASRSAWHIRNHSYYGYRSPCITLASWLPMSWATVSGSLYVYIYTYIYIYIYIYCAHFAYRM